MINSAVIMGLVRHFLTAAGGYLAAKFVIDPNAIAAGVAAIVTLVGVIWSVSSKTPYVPDVAALAAPLVSPDRVPGGVEMAPAAKRGAAMGLLARDPKAPYGRRKDGTPRKAPGRKKIKK